jgi:hypothetical protein
MSYPQRLTSRLSESEPARLVLPRAYAVVPDAVRRLAEHGFPVLDVTVNVYTEVSDEKMLKAL